VRWYGAGDNHKLSGDHKLSGGAEKIGIRDGENAFEMHAE
jgi:hypothetical protein